MTNSNPQTKATIARQKQLHRAEKLASTHLKAWRQQLPRPANVNIFDAR